MKNVRKQKIIKLVRIERSRNYLMSELNYHTTKFFNLNLLEIVMRKKSDIVKKPVYLGLSIVDPSKTVMFFMLEVVLLTSN